MRACFDAVTVNAARAIGLQGYGLDVGCNADFVVLEADRSAANAGWNVVLYWQGLYVVAGKPVPTPNEQQEILQTLHALLKRLMVD